jgi:tetratricopeptide (TPR) repeat protein
MMFNPRSSFRAGLASATASVKSVMYGAPLLCVLLIVGCAATKHGSDASAASAPAGTAGATKAAGSAPAVAATARPLPDVDLTGTLLFELIAAEVALQRGENSSAYATMMKAAQDTADPRLARRATEIALSMRAAAQAMEAAQLWSKLDGGSAEAEQTVGALFVANGRYAEAQPILQKQIGADPDPVAALARMQHLLARAPDATRGLALLDALAQPYRSKGPNAHEVRLILAQGARAAGQTVRAAKEAREALALKPDSEAAAISAAQYTLESKDPDEAAARTAALELLAKFVRRNPAAADARLVYARVLVGAGQTDAARGQFEELVKREQRGADALFALGVLSMQADARDNARSYFERYLQAIGDGQEHEPDPAYLNLARIAEDEQKYDEAMDWLHKVRSADQQPTARIREAYLLARTGRVDDALKMLGALSSETAEDRVNVVMAQGQILRDAHRYQESYDLLDKALQASTDDLNLLYETAMSAERLDRVDVMEMHLRHLVQLKPDYAHAYNALGYTFADRNIRLQEAYELIDKALKLAPEDGFILDSMGWVQYRMGNLTAARDYLGRAYRLKPEADVAAHLGEVLWNQGEKDAARNVFREASRRESDNQTLKETLQRLDVTP